MGIEGRLFLNSKRKIINMGLKAIGLFRDVVVAMFLFIFIGLILIAPKVREFNELKDYRTNNEIINAERNFNRKCPVCGNEVTLHTTEDRNHWYIKCGEYDNGFKVGCGLRTGFYESPEELVEDWNKLGNTKGEN